MQNECYEMSLLLYIEKMTMTVKIYQLITFHHISFHFMIIEDIYPRKRELYGS